MKTPRANRFGSERGVTLVHVSIVLISLMGLGAFAVDRGIVWVSRGQAQNAADAGALAGATARGFDDLADPPKSNGIVPQSATALALSNLVWNEAGAVNVSYECPTDIVGLCVRADVYRNGEFGSNTLPIVLSRILGISSQGVRATATAVVYSANSTDCLRPFAIPDKWVEGPPGPGNDPDVYDPTDGDTYPNPGHGWQLPGDLGVELELYGDADQIESFWFHLLRLPQADGGDGQGVQVGENILTCNGLPQSLGGYIALEPGFSVGNVISPLNDIWGYDDMAHWDETEMKVADSCAPGVCDDGIYHHYSPRIIPIAVYNPQLMYEGRACGGGVSGPQGCIKVEQILGFFITQVNGPPDKSMRGRLVMIPGELLSNAPAPPTEYSFLRTIRLVR